MNQNSRTKNSIYNFLSSIGGQFIIIIMQFIVRTVFIQTLGKSYLGINGLFSNILSMLSLAELGVGNAILFKLYEPLAKKDEQKINTLIQFYKKIYIIIGIVITIIGICLIPFLKYIINDFDSLESLGINAILIYLLYLFQSVSSYMFFAYKSCIVKADQKEYILNLTSYVVTIVSSIIQIILLKIFHNFELYVIILVITTIIQNIINAYIANKYYPYIKKKQNEKIDKKERKEIFKDCAAIFLYRVNGVVLKATDNIIISAILGLEMVAMYSNYYVLYTTINTIFTKVFDSITHSLGNLHTTDDKKHEYTVFKTVNFIAIILGATAAVGIFTLSNNFISLWLGTNWQLPQPFSLLMGIEIYTLVNRVYLSKYRNSMGLFQQAKYRPLFGMIINLICSIIFIKYWGICGVLAGTIIADWTTIMWYDPLIIHKYGFQNEFSITKFYGKNFKYLIITILIGIFNYVICTNFLTSTEWISFITKGIICGLSVPAIFISIFYKDTEGKELAKITKKILRKFKH